MYERIIKRGFSIGGALIGILLLAIPMLVFSLIIFIEDPGPVFFIQKRIGKNKKLFSLLKFRSMRMDTPHDTPTHLLKKPEQYILRCGRWMRKLSIDEIPQLFNIFIGQMAFVGPRPALWNQDDLISERDRYGANDIKPGMTGLAQINGRDELEIPVKAQFDGEYAKTLKKGGVSAFLMDAKCFFGTVGKVFKKEGVVEGGTGEMNNNNC